MKSIRLGVAVKPIALGITKSMPTDMESGNRERAKLYSSSRWRRARLRFLHEHPLCQPCEQQGIICAAYAVDHIDAHARQDWRDRFWDETRWQAICAECHARKSAQELAVWRAQGEGAREG